MNIFDHFDILIPIVTFAFAFGGAAFIFKNNVKVLEELRKLIEKLESKIESMEVYYVKDMKQVMTKAMCEEETNHCTKSRDKIRDSLEKKIDEIQTCLNLQDLKRHELNNKTHICWLEIHEKLATIQANQESNKVMFNTHNAILAERSGHEERIVELEKIMKYRANNAIVSMPFGRRAMDKKEEPDA
jgi:hypothetical protein